MVRPVRTIVGASSKSKALARNLVRQKVKPELRDEAINFINGCNNPVAINHLIERLREK